MRHTPGPWHIVEGDEWTSDIATETPEQGVWTVASCNKRRDEFQANKRLVAAAPDLLDALEKLTAYCGKRFTAEEMPDTEIVPALDAIKKATIGHD